MFPAGKLFLLVCIVVWHAETVAAPPDPAPANGEATHPPYAGFTGHPWDRDYGILSGQCDRVKTGNVLSGADDGDRTVATIVGVTVGALVGKRIGRPLDEGDRRCFGHSLELGKMGRLVSWANETTNVRYQVTPGQERPDLGVGCREFALLARSSSRSSFEDGVACRKNEGVWEVAANAGTAGLK